MKRVPVLFVFIAAMAFGDDFWKTKEPSQWSEKDTKRMLTDSPWTRSAPIDMPGAGPRVGGGGGFDAGMGDISGAGDDMGSEMGGGGGGGRGGRGGRGSRGGGGNVAPSMPASIRALIQWASAAPVREAATKAEAGAVTPEAAAKFYVIRATGVPMRAVMGRGGRGQEQDDPKARIEQLRQVIMKATSLTPKGKEPMIPLRVDVLPSQGGLTVLWLFPRTAIVADDKEVEFKSALGPSKVGAKFRLKDMVYRGELAL